MSDSPLYDSRMVHSGLFVESEWIGWERTEPKLGVIYLRRHLSGPRNDYAPEIWQVVVDTR